MKKENEIVPIVIIRSYPFQAFGPMSRFWIKLKYHLGGLEQAFCWLQKDIGSYLNLKCISTMRAPILKQIDDVCRMYVYVYWSCDKSKIREISLQDKRCVFRFQQSVSPVPKGGRVFVACLGNFPDGLYVHCLRWRTFFVMLSLWTTNQKCWFCPKH